MYLSHTRSKNAVTIFFTDKLPVSISAQSPYFSQIVMGLASGQIENLESLLDKAKMVKTYTKGKFSVAEGQVILNGEALPKTLSNMLFKFIDAGQNTDHLESFWNKLSQNPLDSAKQSLYDWIDANRITIAEDGDFIAYKSIRSDFKDTYSGKFDNSPGKIVEIPREDVDHDRDTTCSRGLHVAQWDYAHNVYGRGNQSITVEVKVNPRDVVAVPNDYNNQKMRVCRYEVIQVVGQPTNTVVYGIEDSAPNIIAEYELPFENIYVANDDVVIWAPTAIEARTVYEDEFGEKPYKLHAYGDGGNYPDLLIEELDYFDIMSVDELLEEYRLEMRDEACVMGNIID
jgi:hypothetical protein